MAGRFVGDERFPFLCSGESLLPPLLASLSLIDYGVLALYLALMLMSLLATLMPALVGLGRKNLSFVTATDKPVRNSCAHH